ncbi:MAG: hypothetical protein DME91_02775 [Verrucomicrobia bacterium]|nr:MAG: hypothetical protein DME91_02775 [Verrucomicrobiota bacterium]
MKKNIEAAGAKVEIK